MFFIDSRMDELFPEGFEFFSPVSIRGIIAGGKGVTPSQVSQMGNLDFYIFFFEILIPIGERIQKRNKLKNLFYC
jgi:hypothetical protein